MWRSGKSLKRNWAVRASGGTWTMFTPIFKSQRIGQACLEWWVTVNFIRVWNDQVPPIQLIFFLHSWKTGARLTSALTTILLMNTLWWAKESSSTSVTAWAKTRSGHTVSWFQIKSSYNMGLCYTLYLKWPFKCFFVPFLPLCLHVYLSCLYHTCFCSARLFVLFAMGSSDPSQIEWLRFTVKGLFL